MRPANERRHYYVTSFLIRWAHRQNDLRHLDGRALGGLLRFLRVTGEFPSQRPGTRGFAVFFDLRLNKRLSKQSRRWWFETPSRSLWRHCNVSPVCGIQMFYINREQPVSQQYNRAVLNKRTKNFLGWNQEENGCHDKVSYRWSKEVIAYSSNKYVSEYLCNCRYGTAPTKKITKITECVISPCAERSHTKM